MAKRKNEKVILENIELKPQVIGHIYAKKTNLGRVLIIFAVLLLVVYYINDISVYVNNLIGKRSATTIQEQANENKKRVHEEENNDGYYMLSDSVTIILEDLTITHFNYNANVLSNVLSNGLSNVLSFDVYNYTENDIDLTNKKYYLETYSSSKVLIDTLKLDFNKVSQKNKISINLDINNDFTYFKVVEKSVNDYPNVILSYDNNGLANIVCSKNSDTITYTFNREGLLKILNVYFDNNTIENYNLRYDSYQNKVNTYNKIEGINASFNITSNGYIATINVDLEKASLNDIDEKYYYGYKEDAKVVKYEMTSYGYSCK